VNNLVKYLEATRASITLNHENKLVKLSVRNNGKGFDVKQFPPVMVYLTCEAGPKKFLTEKTEKAQEFSVSNLHPNHL